MDTDFETVLARFEPEAWRCTPDFANKVRTHLGRRIAEQQGLVFEDLVEIAVDEVPIEIEDEQQPLLVIDEGSVSELILPLDLALRIGRGKHNDLKISGDNKVSRDHCEIAPNGVGWTVTDLASANGTLVNGELLAPHSPRRLFGGEELIVGETFLRFRLR